MVTFSNFEPNKSHPNSDISRDHSVSGKFNDSFAAYSFAFPRVLHESVTPILALEKYY